jgi:hypothetical protein
MMLGFFLLGDSLLLLQYFCLCQIYLACLYPLSSILVGRMCLEICTILLDFPIYWNITFQIINDPLNFIGIT